MARPFSPYHPPPEILAFAKEWEAEINRAVANRMREVGLPEEFIGIQGKLYEDPGAFVLTHVIGGSNNNIPGRRIVGESPGINIDLDVLDTRFPTMIEVDSWTNSRLRDRVDAIIAHEYAEVLHVDTVDGMSPHHHALEVAPETILRISEHARRILREYRRADKLKRGG